MKLKSREASDVVYGESTDWELLEDTKQITDHTRWSVCSSVVAKHKESGRFYLFHYSEGATESQDESAFEYENEVTPTEVALVEKTVEVWEKVSV